jgi:hydroxypyruvate isomerase
MAIRESMKPNGATLGSETAATGLSRRSLFKRLAGGALALSGGIGLPEVARCEAPGAPEWAGKGRVKQSVVHWCYKPMTVPELATQAAGMDLKSVELVLPEYWPGLKAFGLICAMAPSHGFAKGFAQKSEHEECLRMLHQRIDECAAAGFPNVITFSGYRRGLSDEAGLTNMVDGLKQIVGYAEKKNVNLCLEVLNSRVHIEMKGHPDYFSDHVEPAVEVCRQVGSERMKILFDIYHVQIMQGDLITRIKEYHPYIAHYHTGGNPGRNEIDETQEIGYPAIMRAIVETGYQGYVGQEFVPTRDKMASLKKAVKLCDV